MYNAKMNVNVYFKKFFFVGSKSYKTHSLSLNGSCPVQYIMITHTFFVSINSSH